MKRATVILATIFLLCGVVSAQQQPTGQGVGVWIDPQGKSITGVVTGTGTLTSSLSLPVLTISEDGTIKCNLCKSVPVGTNIGTLTDEARVRLFPPRSPIVIGPSQIPTWLTIGEGSLTVTGDANDTMTVGSTKPRKKYAHAQQPKPKADPIGDAIKAESDAATAFNTAKANLDAARANTQAVLFREMAEAGVKPSECASVDAQGNSNPFACINRDAKTGTWSFVPKQSASKPDPAKTDKSKP